LGDRKMDIFCPQKCPILRFWKKFWKK